MPSTNMPLNPFVNIPMSKEKVAYLAPFLAKAAIEIEARILTTIANAIR